ncbi:hypothetical protein BOSE62_71127 [Bosea sp. 62]|nr:hypothetical protein BOSE21B_90511 [Bosea sp. 21B]CAD5296930.1 hypothetical protein BOSE46_80598 [Bosea sp. 46]CAD5297188.1 hypothetical protein BOSE7B_60154 [Bosea sp. 7B]VVT61157.1 hypothetical protein BOS5A_230434 [Bosea sp. EC-HK365B]VXB16983.1 hypothetical protein BOSE125_130122 [Bosea sp. 125]VXB26343.1 hypothetical protein BOSE127_110153 [Bosea sp. 127]VXC79749.1 hypothetical protein BOSE29B_80486 [Bosea sp. 29B]VXC86871.1 hypothetical protein BOSE62_71127 [Bosea sp. 62]
MLVVDDLLPGAGAGTDLAGQQRLQARLRLGTDAEGPEAGAGGGAGRRRLDAARLGGGAGLRSAQCLGRRWHRLLRHHPSAARARKHLSQHPAAGERSHTYNSAFDPVPIGTKAE